MKNPISTPPWATLAMAATLGLGAAACHTGTSFTPILASRSCKDQTLDPQFLDDAIRPNVVRVFSSSGSGTGFIVAARDSDQKYVITNYHVIDCGYEMLARSPDKKCSTTFQVEILTDSEELIRLSGVEVVKTDPKSDLALLRMPKISTRSPGLRLNAKEAKISQKVFALGFPRVSTSDYEMTVESGEISAAARKLDNQSYIQTNANINPGNSGGPLIDACGRVVGVVVATVRNTERTNLIIPADKAFDLYTAYAQERKPLDTEVDARLAQFFSAIKYDQLEEAYGYLSIDFVAGRVLPMVVNVVFPVLQKLESVEGTLRAQGRTLTNLPEREFLQTVEFYQPLSPPEQAWVHMMYHAIHEKTDGDAMLMKMLFVSSMPEIFSDSTTHRIDKIEEVADDTVRVRVEIDSGKENSDAQRWLVDLRYEWGDWKISDIDAKNINIDEL
mgnify:CR=1 FL=1